jgi:hypothetical protein
MEHIATIEQQLVNGIVGSFDALLRWQKPGPHVLSPLVPATFTSIRVCGTRVYDSCGNLWADIGEEGMRKLMSIKAIPRSETHNDEEEFFEQFANDMGIDPTYYCTSPVIFLLPEQCEHPRAQNNMTERQVLAAFGL